MATNHLVSSGFHDRYQGAVKAKELRSHKHENVNMHVGLREEGAKPEQKHYDRFDKGFKLIDESAWSHQSRDKLDGPDHSHRGMHVYDRKGHFDKRNFAGHNAHHHGIEIHKGFPEPIQSVQIRQVTYTPSAAFSGTHLGSRGEIADAHKNFISAALGFLDNPNKETYKALTESMTKLLDPRFTPAANGGAVNVQVRNVNGTLMAKFTMEVTPAATKTLDEAREDLKKAYSSGRDGDKDIAGIRADAYANYIRALSEKFKQDGTIKHTNHTPTTPVFKTTTIYMVQVTSLKLTNLHELKKPHFGHQIKGKLHMKDHRNLWNDYRNHNKSYVDMLKHDPKKSHIDTNFKSGKGIGSMPSYRHSGENRMDRGHHNHPQHKVHPYRG